MADLDCRRGDDVTAEPVPDARPLAIFCAEANPWAPELPCSLLPHDPTLVEHSSNGSTWPTSADEEER